MANQKKSEWTVFFIIKADGGSIAQAIGMIREIRSLKLNLHTSVVLCLHFARENLKAVIESDESFISNDDEETITTMFFSIEPEYRKDKKLPSRIRVIAEDDGFDITNPDSLEIFFRNQVLNFYLAEHYLLFTWDHGRAYGIFSDKIVVGDAEKNVQPKLIIKRDEQVILTMDELASAIRWAFGKKKIDVVIMMNCLMQFIDAGYALRKVAKYFVAPQTDIDFAGYNYPFIFQLLAENPKISPRKLAKFIVKSFKSKVYSDKQTGIYIKDTTAIYATDLRYYTLLGKSIDALVDILLPQLPAIKPIIDNIRRKSAYDLTRNLIDFYTFVTCLEDENIFKNDVLYASLILSIKDLIVIKGCIGQKLQNPSTGFSIFFPNALPVEGKPRDGFDDFFATDFYKETKWGQFIATCVV